MQIDSLSLMISKKSNLSVALGCSNYPNTGCG